MKLKGHEPEKPTGVACFCAGRVRGELISLGRRLGSSRGLEITGFTLIELLMVMVIISILGSIAYYKYSGFIQQTKVTRAIADIKQIAQYIIEFRGREGRYPNDLNELGRGEFKDPWGRPYYYVVIEADLKKKDQEQEYRQDKSMKPINTGFDIFSCGADGKWHRQVQNEPSRDDIIWAWDGEFIGLGKDVDSLDMKKQLKQEEKEKKQEEKEEKKEEKEEEKEEKKEKKP